MTNNRKLLFSVIIVANVLVLAVIVSSPTHYKVDFSSVLEMWGDVLRDVDRFGLTLTTLPVEREIEIGDETVRQFPLRPEHPQQQYLSEVGAKMAKTAARRRIPYRFHVVSMGAPNAFAVPGGHVLVTTGMLDLIESEAELAAILGHEIAHIDLKHCIENLQYQLFLERIVGSQLSQIVGIAYRLAAFGFSEIQEREADRSAIILMAKAGYSPLEAVKLYQRMEQKLGNGRKPQERTKGPEGEILRGIVDALKDYFATHPATVSRMRDIEAIFDRNMSVWEGRTLYVGRSNYVDRISQDTEHRASEQIVFSTTSPEFWSLRGQTAALAGNSREAVGMLTKAIDLGLENVDNRRARAAAYVELGELDKAAVDAAHIIKTTNAQIEVYLTKAHSLETAGDRSGAISAFREALQSYEILLETSTFWFLFTKPLVDRQKISDLRDQAADGLLKTQLETGRLYFDMGHSTDALEIFDTILRAHKLNLAAIEGAALARLALGRKEEVLSWLKTLVRDYSYYAELFNIRAKVYRAAGDTKKADREYARYIRYRDDKVPPLSDEYWVELENFWDDSKFGHFKAFAVPVERHGVWWWRTRNWEWSRAAAANAVRSCSKKPGRKCKLYALGERVVWSLDNDELEAAHDEYAREVRQAVIDQIKDFSKRIDEGEWGAYLLRGDGHVKLKEFEKAIADYSAYLQTVPGEPGALLKRGVAYFRAGRFARALEDLKQVKSDPVVYRGYSYDSTETSAKSKDLLRYRGFSYLYLGQLDSAYKDFESLILRKGRYLGFLGRAAVKLARGNVAGGVQDLKFVIDANQGSARYHNEVCWTLLNFALPAAAKPFCVKANDLTVMHPDRMDSLAFMHWQIGNIEEARKYLTDVQYVDPSYPDHEIRFAEYRVLMTTTFLILRGYHPGMVKKKIDGEVRFAIKVYQRDHGLSQTGEIDEELLGHLTPLGFGSFRIEKLPGKLSRKRIELDCSNASLGKLVLITLSSGEKYRCNTDGLSVRRASSEDIEKEIIQPAMKPMAEFQDCHQCPRMVVIPAGSFEMGSPLTERDRDPAEGPVHKVTFLSQIAVGKYEVTKGEFSVFVRETAYDRGEACQTGFEQEVFEPVTCVSWKDAKAYVKWLSEKTKKTYRLLSETEWEYVARAGTTSPFATGSTITTDQANFDGRHTYNESARGRFRGVTTGVGRFPPNGFGIYDMNGNVREWVEDCWAKNYEQANSDGSAYIDGDCTYRTVRGGSWKDLPIKLRSAARGGLQAHSQFNNNGFRVARDLGP